MRCGHERITEDLAWGRDYMAPWLWSRLRGRATRDGRTSKLPTLTEIAA